MAFARSRQALAIAGVLGLALGVTACGTGNDKKSSSKASSPECAPYEKYQGHDGKKVTIYSSIRDIEADRLAQSWKQFEDCTGIKIDHEGSGEFEAQLGVRVDGGNAPDLAFIPQPGLLKRFADAGKLKPAGADTKAMAEQNYSPDWLKYSTVDGKFYGAPLGSNVKSFVWYSPKTFKEKGWQVPQTWDDLIKLSDQIAASGTKPWCAGIESGDATGWPATDWIEDLMLRTAGPEVYDQWTTHGIPFNDPKVADAVNKAGTILKNDKYVNGGFGGVKSIATTSFQEAGTPITTGKCALHRQASFYANQWPQGTKVAEDGDVFAFYFPAVDPAKGKPVLGGGEFVTAFADRPEVQAVQTYLASGEYANSRAKIGDWVSANKKLDLNNVPNPVDKLSVQILQDPKTVFRFDGSDLMPAAVGAGTFWKGMVDWINGKDTTTVLNGIESSWK
ncbi:MULTISPECIES: ABC transporter substrate-binding protein [Micromonospora]|uniref:Carbohydrate ABC transporter substrate-binding protein n=1 Tax=Micromonospora solifontis TaxID=2487138 RepID=A0ABX9WE73_9ACTN|nr:MULTISPECIES: ABC transporter substrate-binding protein [Micromonospora]NES16783.1 carbohydrate ABC transporter substrate-binding protein [Micromonospora sp. PPF5-17B]NES37801.1 carbohydrate ABC transporter substrate-binding protein [Micromonospora solifontis]NES59160.1 carbohydrate ABC transporter substrate-binding protein [Micromonospora sp. PPF5-6]RNL97901.1 carbohydrate ABC transporter substrate-binding protein [Micromonospora solifontis]